MKNLILAFLAVAVVGCSHKSNNSGDGPAPLDPVVTQQDLEGLPGDFIGHWKFASCSAAVGTLVNPCAVDINIESSAPNQLFIELIGDWTESFATHVVGNDLTGGMGTIGKIGKLAMDVNYWDADRRLTVKLVTPKMLVFTWKTPGLGPQKTVYSGTVTRP